MMHSESSGSTEWRAFLICDATHPFDLFRVNNSLTSHLPHPTSPHPTCTMNIFRLLGKPFLKPHCFAELTRTADFSHLASIFILLQKMKTSSVCRILLSFACLPPNLDRRVVPGCPLNRKCSIYSSSSLAISVSS